MAGAFAPAIAPPGLEPGLSWSRGAAVTGQPPATCHNLRESCPPKLEFVGLHAVLCRILLAQVLDVTALQKSDSRLVSHEGTYAKAAWRQKAAPCCVARGFAERRVGRIEPFLSFKAIAHIDVSHSSSFSGTGCFCFFVLQVEVRQGVVDPNCYNDCRCRPLIGQSHLRSTKMQHRLPSIALLLGDWHLCFHDRLA